MYFKSTSTEDFPEMYLSTFQVLYKLYLSTDVLKYKVLVPGSGLDNNRSRLMNWSTSFLKSDVVEAMISVSEH